MSKRVKIKSAKAVSKAASKPKTARTAKPETKAKATPKPARGAPAKVVAPRPKKAAAVTSKVVTRAAQKTQDKKLTARATVPAIVLPPDYRPSEDEPFMSELQRLYFRNRLMVWKEEIVRQTKETLAGLHEDSTQHADIADRATSETDRALELRARDRQRKLVSKIDAALSRIEDGTYGYCEETGEPIGVKRLEARPIATLSLEAQERHERRERVYREEN